MKVKKNLGKILILLVVFLLLILFLNSYFFWQKNYQNRIYPNIKIGEIDLSGKAFAEAREIISRQTKTIETAGLKFQHDSKEANIAASIFSFDSDLSYPALAYEVDSTVLQAFGGSLNRSFFHYLINKLNAKKQKNIKAIYNLDQEKIKTLLKEAFEELEISSANAHFSLIENKKDDPKLQSQPEKLGKEINYEQVFADLQKNLENLENNTIIIKTRTKYPGVKQIDLITLEKEAQEIISHGSLVLRFDETLNGKNSEKIWEIKPDRLTTWISVKKNDEKLELSLDQEKIKEYLKSYITPQIDKEIIRPRFEIQDNKVTSWQIGRDGRKVNLEATINKIIEELINNNQQEVFLIVDALPSDDITAENNFHIKEIIGTGHSNFIGSPANRRHNIKTGADALHGILIKPEEEFSLVKTLGEIDAGSGYLQELVIKGNKTIPEYGGGLCQIGTTVFRSALASGLPITARQNHSYRVSYYEPAGMDAAVYDPWPDVRLINDTGNYILIQARIEKDDLYFDFWGVKDGRIASTTQPTIYNIVKPAPTKLIETTDLAPGEKKCTEHSHNGADAYFDYQVIYPEGATTTPVVETRFKSHYVPWQEVCLIGIEQATSTATSTIATTTETTIIE